uniref:Alpha 5 bundlin n=1 Tax=Escherichia coli TaxID=562 RepID=C3W979_ECOLX|nr:alpha 5 bundlin [Escherichia coli]
MVSKIMNKKYEKGLSLIESAMVLALAATVTAGVMFYYQSASDSNKSQNAISEVMSATSAINGLYIGQTSYSGLDSTILLNTSAIPDNYKDTTNKKITNPFGGKLNVGPANNNTAFGYYLTLTGLDKAACVSLATLNLGTSAKGYGVNISGENNITSFGNGADQAAKSTAITPAEAATACKNTDSTNKVTYFMK